MIAKTFRGTIITCYLVTKRKFFKYFRTTAISLRSFWRGACRVTVFNALGISKDLIWFKKEGNVKYNFWLFLAKCSYGISTKEKEEFLEFRLIKIL